MDHWTNCSLNGTVDAAKQLISYSCYATVVVRDSRTADGSVSVPGLLMVLD